MARNTIAAKASDPSLPVKVDVYSNADRTRSVSLLGGFVRLTYYESILQDSIKVNYIFADSGNSIDSKSVVEGLPLIGTEDVQLEIEDNNENKIKVDLNVNKITPIYEDTGKSMINLSLVSEQFIRNEEGSSRIIERYDGKISDHVTSILTMKLKAKKGKKLKEANIEETEGNYNFLGNGRKPYYILNWLSKASTPIVGKETGYSAGFLFFETSEGFHFKSIDALFAQPQKKSFIYNESTDLKKGIPAGYDGKILEQSSDNAINVQDRMKMGIYKTKLVLFDPFNCKYEVIEKAAKEPDPGDSTGKKEVAKGLKLAGKELPTLNKKFDNKFTRTTYMLVDTGSLPTGKYKPGTEGPNDDQVSKNMDPNFQAALTLNQAIRRYNQVFSGMQEITIAGDFSLHAGDVIFVDLPAIKAETDDTVDRQTGGLYIIADLCHLVTANGTWTKLNLARDSFGRKGNHSTR